MSIVEVNVAALYIIENVDILIDIRILYYNFKVTILIYFFSIICEDNFITFFKTFTKK